MTSLDYFTQRADELDRVAVMWEGCAATCAEFAAYLDMGVTTPNGRPGVDIAKREADALAKIADSARRDADYARQIAASVAAHPDQPREHPVPCKGMVHPLRHRPDTWNVNGLCDTCSEDQLEQRILDLEARLDRVAVMWEGCAATCAAPAAYLDMGVTTPNGRPGVDIAKREADALAKIADSARSVADYARQIAASVAAHPDQPREHPVPCKGMVHPLRHRPDTWNVNGLCDTCSEDQLEQRILDLEARDRALHLADSMGGV